MQQQESLTHNVMNIINALPSDLQKEVAHYAEYIHLRRLRKEGGRKAGGAADDWRKDDALMLSLPSLWRDWDSDEDAIYDNL